MARRGRTGQGWDAAPPRTKRTPTTPGAANQQPAAEPPAAAPPTSEPPPDPAEQAREICLQQLAVRPRTRAELATALRRRGVDDAVAAQVLDRYSDVGMIDDAGFAQAWVSSRHRGRGLARRALGSELRQRGVDTATIGEALEQLDSDTEAATARALVDRKLRTTSGPPEAVVRRLVGMLARKGYPAGLAFRVVKEALAEDERTAEAADQLDPDALAEATGGADPDPDAAG